LFWLLPILHSRLTFSSSFFFFLFAGTDLPPPRERFDPNKMLRDRYNSGGAGMAAGAMGSLLRL
jgi:hypothetical protein